MLVCGFWPKNTFKLRLCSQQTLFQAFTQKPNDIGMMEMEVLNFCFGVLANKTNVKIPWDHVQDKPYIRNLTKNTFNQEKTTTDFMTMVLEVPKYTFLIFGQRKYIELVFATGLIIDSLPKKNMDFRTMDPEVLKFLGYGFQKQCKHILSFCSPLTLFQTFNQKLIQKPTDFTAMQMEELNRLILGYGLQKQCENTLKSCSRQTRISRI